MLIFITFFHRQDLQTAGINFTQKPKISFFARSRRLVEPIYVKFGTAEEHMDPLARAKLHDNRCIDVGTRPRKFHFLDRFEKS